MKLLYATGNPAKFAAMQRRLIPLGIELHSLNDMREKGEIIPQVEESGTTPLENARIKAKTYYEAFQMPVFSCDSGLYFDNVPKAEQPGVHVRTVNGEYLSDEQVQRRLIGLVEKYGTLTAYYRNAICFVLDEMHVYEAMDETMESERFFITDTPHASANEGFPIDSLSVDIETGKYYYDLSAEARDKLAVEDGFLEFFKKNLRDLQKLAIPYF